MSETLTKHKIVAHLHNELGFSKREARNLLDLLLETLSDTLEQGEAVTLTKFGHFKVLNKQERPGRNPATGDEVTISARKVVVFYASKTWRHQDIEEATGNHGD